MFQTSATKLVKITTNNQVAIPAFVMRDLRLKIGTYLEVKEKGWHILMTPKRIVGEEDFAMFKNMVLKGRGQLAKGKTVRWERVKKKLDAQAKSHSSR